MMSAGTYHGYVDFVISGVTAHIYLREFDAAGLG